jgi:hypothetical protein
MTDTETKIDEARMKNVAEEAQFAFWAKVVELYPEVKSGDFPPIDTLIFDKSCEEALNTWLRWNHPDCQE